MDTMNSFDGSDDILDSRDVIERIAELEERVSSEDPDDALDQAEVYELDQLRALAAAGEDLADWEYGETLIRDSYFEDYARELAEDIGAITGDESWPLSYIDWEAAADALRMDYTAFKFCGVTYWGRS